MEDSVLERAAAWIADHVEMVQESVECLFLEVEVDETGKLVPVPGDLRETFPKKLLYYQEMDSKATFDDFDAVLSRAIEATSDRPVNNAT